MVKPKISFNRSMLLRAAVSFVLLAAAIYVLAAHWQTVRRSLATAQTASLSWLLLAILLMASTFVIAGAIYGILALHPLRYRQTIIVEVATGLVNKLLPAGIGGLGLHGVYLYKRGHKAAEAAVIVTLNNAIGLAGHLLLVGAVALFDPTVLQQLWRSRHIHLSWQMVAAVSVVIVIVLAIPAVRHRIGRVAASLFASIRRVRRLHLVGALGLAMLFTAVYTLILFCCSRSIGLRLNIVQIFIIFSVGMLTGTATPTPGGLAGAEAGLFAGLIAYGVRAPSAGACVLLYRSITYWLILLPGLFALLLARRRKLV